MDNIPPIFDEIQLRAKCTIEHGLNFCAECDNTGYINLWVKVSDVLKYVTMDEMPVNLQWNPPQIVVVEVDEDDEGFEFAQEQ